MTDDEAQQGIFAEWMSWRGRERIGTEPDGVEASMFFRHLETEKPQLLAFKCLHDDRWRIVHDWLTSAHLLAD